MDKRMMELLEFEKRLLQDREQLQKLLEENEMTDSQLVKDKLNFFKQEIEHMNRQVKILSYDLEKSSASVRSLEKNDDTGKSIPKQEAAMRSIPKAVAETVVETVVETALEEQQEQPVMQTAPPVKQKNDLEKTIGKSFMGVFASVLIFISLILFATLLLPYFNDTIKMVMSYLIGFVFTGVGLIKLRKDKENKFFIALTGCGIGVVYISLLLSNIYFKVLGDIPLYMLICIWGVGICLLSRLQHKIFQVIGELGIMISLFFGCGLCGTNGDTTKFVALIIFYMITSTIFYLVHYQATFAGNRMHHGFHILNCAILLITCADLFRKGFHIAEWMVLLVIAFGFGSMLLNRLEKSNVSFGIFSALYLYQLYGILARVFEKDVVFGSIAYIVCMLLLLLIEWKPADKKGGKYFVQGNLILFMTMALAYCESVYDYGIVLLIILPILFLGFVRKNEIFKYGSCILLLGYTFDSLQIGELEHFVLEGVALGVATACIYSFKEQYSRTFKNVVHLLTIVFIVTCLGDTMHEFVQNDNLEQTVVFIIAAAFNIVMKKTIFGRNPASGEPEPPVLYNSVNLYFMASGIGLLNYVEGAWKFFLILMVIATFMVNAKNMLDNRGNMIGGMYVGLKFTVLMIAILKSFSAESYIVSVACLIFAIVCIVIGFMAQYKALRIFGLILSMVSIFKLIMVDINYDNTLGNALSFFVSGILCFVISLIYNFIDGKVKQKEEL